MTELWAINVLLGFISFGLGVWINNLNSRLKAQDDVINSLHETYAKKDDVRGDFEIIRDSLRRIEDKLDRKQDRG